MATSLAALGAPVALADIGPLTLPDNRAWEQVSPVEKQGNDIYHGAAMAAIGGERLLFKSPGAFAGAPSSLSSAGGVSYIASRGAEGWGTAPIMPQAGTYGGANGYEGFTADLSRGVLSWVDAIEPIDPEAHPSGQNLYLHDTAGGQFQLLNVAGTTSIYDRGFTWGSSDLGKVGITTGHGLTPDSPCPQVEDPPPVEAFHPCAYEWDHGTMRLASVLPNEEPARGAVGNDIDAKGSTDHAVSEDGSRLFFTNPSGGGDPGRQLYVREDGTSTQLVSASERSAPGGVSGKSVNFQDAEAAHGNLVLFTTENTLLDADQDTTNDLYLADLTRPSGERLALISQDQNPAVPNGAAVDEGETGGGAQVYGGVAGASEDLRRIYFVADNQIIAGAPEAPGPKLYLWDDTGAEPQLTYIATLASEDSGAWLPRAQDSSHYRERTSRVSADGGFLAILSQAQLTEFENEGRKELYLFDAATKSLQCASCSADAFPVDGQIAFNTPAFGFFGIVPKNHVLNNLSGSGQVFFQTTRGLLPRDSNGKLDVYEYEDGALHLISSGTGDADSNFLDAAPSGSDVFFVTRDRLVGWDKDTLYDVYDARVNGGLPEPPPPPPPCEGDSCQPPAVVPTDPSLASVGFEGPGNAKPRKAHRCRHAKARKHERCRAKRKAHAKRKEIGR